MRGAGRVRSIGTAGVAFVVLAGSVSACSSGSDDSQPSTTTFRKPAVSAPALEHAPYRVGVMTETFVDQSRSTPRSGDRPERPERKLRTRIFYPAQDAADSASPVEDAPPDREHGPYPLVVFAHGYSAAPEVYRDLLSGWAAAGYVVAAPVFPLSSGVTPGGPDQSDVVNQPGDVSFVVTSVLKASDAAGGPLAGLVDGDAVAAAGHSNGGITMLGLVANTCCRDERVKAVISLSGTPLDFPGGRYRYDDAAPVLLVHGTDDALVPYDASVDVFNEARGPKGIVTIEDGDHAAWLLRPHDAFSSVLDATLAFLAAYAVGIRGAVDRIEQAADDGVTTVRFEPEPGSKATMPTVPEPETDRKASVTPDSGLEGGQRVTVSWSGFTPGKVVNVVQCAANEGSTPAACDLVHAKILQPNPTGEGSLELEIVEGRVGTGVCDAAHPGCLIAVNDGSSLDPEATLRLPISFAP